MGRLTSIPTTEESKLDRWDAYRSQVSTRLLLPLKNYQFQIEFVEEAFSESQKVQLSQLLRAGILNAIRKQPQFHMSSVRFLSSSDPDSIFSVNYGAPVEAFGFNMTTSSIALFKSNCSLESYVLSLSLFTEVFRQVLGRESPFSLAKLEFLNSIYRVSHNYAQNIELGTHLTDDTKLRTSTEILAMLLQRQKGSIAESLQPDEYLRSDFSFTMAKDVAGKAAAIGVGLSAPWTPTLRDLNVELFLHRPDPRFGLPYEDSWLEEFDVVAEAFYRDIIVERLYKQLFTDTQVTARVA